MAKLDALCRPPHLRVRSCEAEQVGLHMQSVIAPYCICFFSARSSQAYESLYRQILARPFMRFRCFGIAFSPEPPAQSFPCPLLIYPDRAQPLRTAYLRIRKSSIHCPSRLLHYHLTGYQDSGHLLVARPCLAADAPWGSQQVSLSPLLCMQLDCHRYIRLMDCARVTQSRDGLS